MTWYADSYTESLVQCIACGKGYIRAAAEQLQSCPNCTRVDHAPDIPVSNCLLCGSDKIQCVRLTRGAVQGWWCHACATCGYHGDSVKPTRKQSVETWNRSNEHGEEKDRGTSDRRT